MTRQRIDRTQAHQWHRQGQPGDVEQQAFERLGSPGRAPVNGGRRYRLVGRWRQVDLHQRLDRCRQLSSNFDTDRFRFGLRRGRYNRHDRREHHGRRFGERQRRCLDCHRLVQTRNLGITCLFLKHRRLELIDLNQRFGQFKHFGGFVQQTVKVRLQRQLRAGSKLLRTIHQATCWAMLCVNRCLSSAR
ncbi:hypothetical protein D3C76_1298590 [compost metagenome]